MSKIPIVFTFDKRIVLGSAVAIKSLIDTALPTTSYDIYVYHPDIDKKTIAEFEKLVKNTRHTITFEFVSKEKFKNAPINKHGSWQEIVYYRLLIPELLPHYDKVIYSDVDVLFKDDLSQIYNIDIEEYECAAVATCTSEAIKTLQPQRYFPENKNEFIYASGFLMFNSKKAREENFVQRIFETIKTFNKRLVFFDMDTFNLTCNKIKSLPLNCCVFETLYEENEITKILEYDKLQTIYTLEDFKNAKENPIIIHYAGKLGKPWQRRNVPRYWEEYLHRIPKKLIKYTFRDLRKKYLSKIKYPKQHFDVALVNFYHTQNYGACLTAWALQEIIKETGNTCAFLNEFEIKDKHKTKPCSIFVNRELKLLPKFNNLKKTANIANIFISGSDQVFRPKYLKKKDAFNKYLLKFTNEKKIAFSASFGIGQKEYLKTKPKFVERFKKELEKFDYISTREVSGVDICEDNLSLKADFILDPVFLIDKEKYQNLIKKSDKTFENKLVSYVLDKESFDNKVLKTLLTKLDLENTRLNQNEHSVYDWIKAFYEAEFIITDSYHGACFAIIFNKPFICLMNRKRGLARFDSLKQVFNIKSPFVEKEDLTSDFKPKTTYNWGKINKIISVQRQKGLNVLEKQLSSKKSDFICKNCTGCSACFNICPKGAITMNENYEGFLYPVVDRKKCINCGLCQKTCPVNLPIKNKNIKNPTCFAAAANDETRLSGSSSGGISPLLMEEVLNNQGFIAGAIYDEDFRIIHKVSNDSNDLEKFKGSKYYQSNTLNVYSTIKNLLEENKTVLFTGTPCQVAGLKNFLRKDYENLLTVDIVCHGTPSYKFFKKYTDEICADDKISKVDFRSKKTDWNTNSLLEITFNNNKITEIKKEENLYVKAFLSNLIIRKSCSSCPFQKLPRQGDLTIGDFWKIDRFDVSLNDKKGLSLILINNSKGEKLYKNIQDKLITNKKVPIKYAIRGNKTIIKPTKKNPKRESYILKLLKGSYKEVNK